MNLKQWLKLLFFTFTLLVATPDTLGQEQDDLRSFDREAIEGYRNNPEFDYTQEYVQSGSGFSLLIAYLGGLLADFLNRPSVGEVMPVVLKMTIALGIIVALILIFRLRFSNAFSRGSKDLEYPVFAYSAEQGEDYHQLYEESLRDQEYKLAARYLFLYSLGVLHWSYDVKVTKWKAPHDYLKDLPEEKKPSFRYIVNLFENSWYGDYNPDSNSLSEGYNHIKTLRNA